MVLDQHYAGCSSSPEVGKLVKALAQAQAAYKPVAKSASFEGRDTYRYSTWKDICDALLPSLLANGLVFIPRTTVTASGWQMVGTLAHGDSGEWISSTCPIRDNGSVDPRQWEIACTYAKKNLLLCLAGGWAEGDEAEDQDVAEDAKVEEQIDQEIVAYEAIKAKVEGYLKLVTNNPAKMQEAHQKMDSLVEKGELRKPDAEWLKGAYPIPEPKKEKANAR
jgi:hypothetical protein